MTDFPEARGKRMRPGRIVRASSLAVALVALAALTSCDGGDEREQVYTAILQDGTYRVVAGEGFAAGDEARVLAITARLDRAGGRLVFTLGDASERTLAFSPRSPDRWQADCFTMASHWVNEVADLSAAALRLESLTFETPVVFAMCGPRMILADGLGPPAPPWLAFDPQ